MPTPHAASPPAPRPARPATSRPPGRRDAARPARPKPAPSDATPAERARLRRLVRRGVAAVVAVQAVAFVLLVSPQARAQFAVIDAAVVAAINAMNGSVTGSVNGVNGSVNSGFSTANARLSTMDQNIARMRQLADQHSVASTRTFRDSIAAVTSRPTGRLTSTRGAISYASPGAGAELGRLVPGAVPWQNFNRDYTASANAAILTLRGGMNALHEFNRSIENAERLNSLATAARGSNSYLELDQLQVETQLEVARQLQALRAQQALSTNLYAVTESHRIGSEARQRAQDNHSGCSILSEIIGGLPGAAITAATCGASSPGTGG
jgi:hypothetical protein